MNDLRLHPAHVAAITFLLALAVNDIPNPVLMKLFPARTQNVAVTDIGHLWIDSIPALSQFAPHCPGGEQQNCSLGPAGYKMISILQAGQDRASACPLV